MGYALAHALAPYSQAPNALNAAGYVLLAEDRVDAAVKVFYANTRLFPEHADAHDSLAEALAARGDFGAALDHQRRAVLLAPADEALLARLEGYAARAGVGEDRGGK